jgi:hypothetical protein
MISMLANLGTFSKAVWKDRYTKLHDSNDTSSPTSDLDADIANCYANPQDLLAFDRQLLKLKMDPQHTPRPSSLSCRAPQSVVFYMPFLRPISSHSRTQ